MGKTVSNKVFYSEFVCRLLSAKNLNKLERAVGKYDLGFLFVRIADFYSYVEVYGVEAGFELLRASEEEITARFRSFFQGCEIIFAENIGLNEHIVCFYLPDRHTFNLSDQVLSFRSDMCERISRKVSAGYKPDLSVGYSQANRQSKGSFYKIVFRAICEAQKSANIGISSDKLNLRDYFTEILEKPLLQSVYQPIVNLKTGGISGWEAFVRGPEQSYFHQPASLYAYASEIGMISVLDKKCVKQAINDFGNSSSAQRLFINIHTESLNAGTLLAELMPECADKHLKNPENIVLEFSESCGIRDYTLFLENIGLYRKQGFRIAIDEMGHSTPLFISRIRPDYIKIDTSLIRGISYYPVKEAIVAGFVTLCERIGAQLIAVGIETETELRTLVSLGVQFGQGYYLAKPSYPKPGEPVSLPAELSGDKAADMKLAVSVRNLVETPILISPETTVGEVKALLRDKSSLCGVVIAVGNKAKGLLMSYQMDRQLGTLYGVSLFYKRNVSLLMDHEPLIVEASQSVGEVAKAAMSRQISKIYDDIIVTEHDAVIGTVSVQRMLETLAKIEFQAREVAEAATRAKSSFLAAMSHDIRTPMNAILGMADMLRESPLTSEQEKYVSIFQNAGESLLELINEILDLSKVEAGQVELESISFNLAELVEKTCEVMAVKAHQNNTKLHWHIDPQLPACINGDPTRLRQILMNLIGNAVRFTQNGEIRVTVQNAKCKMQNDSFALCTLYFAITDTGVGIPKDRQRDIFKSFTQAHSLREYGGTGLGLAICKHLVGLMGGTIGVESESGVGSTFYFTARFSSSTEEILCKTPEVPETEIIQNIKPLRILLAEDNENNRLLFGFYLKDTPYHTDIAENGKICVEKYTDGQYDIVFMDIDMPIMDGYQATDAIRKWEKERSLLPVPIIALTAHALKGKKQESLDAGCTDYMAKPFKKRELLKILKKYSEPDLSLPDTSECQIPACPMPSETRKKKVSINAEIRELIPGFLKNTQEEISSLQDAVSEKNYEMIRRLGHRIKGACLCYGFEEMGGIGGQIESAGQEKDDLQSVHSLVNEIAFYMDHVEIVYEANSDSHFEK